MSRVRKEDFVRQKRGLADLELVNEDGDGVELVVLLRIHVVGLEL